MPATVYLITGGVRSGKSGYAQQLCERICETPIYLATSDNSWCDDDDFKSRVKRHQDDRGERWTTIEEPMRPSFHSEAFCGKAIMVDCLTLWLTNYMMKEGAFQMPSSSSDAKAGTDVDAPERALEAIKNEFDEMVKQWNATFVFVTNELGSGTHAESAMSRKFVDVHGWLNQHVAKRAERVIHMVCGIPNMIKEPKDDARNPLLVPNTQQIEDAEMVDKLLSTRGMQMEAKGYFIIKVDHSRALLIAQFFSCMVNDKGEVCDLNGKKLPCNGKRPEPFKVFEGRTAKELTVNIFEKWSDVDDLVSFLGHAAYVGREAQKAEDCLYSGKHYQQN